MLPQHKQDRQLGLVELLFLDERDVEVEGSAEVPDDLALGLALAGFMVDGQDVLARPGQRRPLRPYARSLAALGEGPGVEEDPLEIQRGQVGPEAPPDVTGAVEQDAQAGQLVRIEGHGPAVYPSAAAAAGSTR